MSSRLACCLLAFQFVACLEDPVGAPPETPDAGDQTPDAGDPEPRCGDGIVNGADHCDGTALGDATCTSLDFAGGTLACTTMCEFDTTGCTPLEWPRELPGGSLELYAGGIDLATTPDDGLYVAGSAYPRSGVVDLGNGPLTVNPNANRLRYVTKFDRNGAFQWVHVETGNSYEYSHAYAVASDAQGNAFVTGGVDPELGEGTEPAAIFLQKLTPSGEVVFEKQFPMTSEASENSTMLAIDDQAGYAVGTDAAGNVSVSGHFVETVDLGGEVLSAGSAPGATGVFVARFDSDGNHIWSRGWGLDEVYVHTTSCTLPDGQTILSLRGEGTVDFGGGPLGDATGTGYLAKFDAQGNHVWSLARPIILYRITCTPDGGFVGVGHFDDGQPGSAVILRYDADGELAWERILAPGGIGNAVALTAAGEIIFGGAFRGEPLTLGDTTLPSPPAEGDRHFVARLTANGEPRTAVALGTGHSLNPRRVAVSRSGDVYAAGTSTSNPTTGLSMYVMRVPLR